MNNYKATGRLVLDPEERTLPNGTTVCKLRLAVKGLARGQDEVGYINATSFGTSAEAAARVLSKGWLVAVDGRLEYHDWETADGGKRRDWEVIGHVEFLAAPRSEQPDALTLEQTPDEVHPDLSVVEPIAA
jgi:single-strand DNA-binding protein